jgi:hypothetical protein
MDGPERFVHDRRLEEPDQEHSRSGPGSPFGGGIASVRAAERRADGVVLTSALGHPRQDVRLAAVSALGHLE